MSREHIHAPSGLSDRLADIITGFVGSWLFVGIHVGWFVLWLWLHLDINLLTLIVSLEAIFLSTFVLMSQNRQAAKDHLRDDTEASEVTELFTINQTQLKILQILRGEDDSLPKWQRRSSSA
jgi:uncharacterized membrane protein